MPVCPASPCTSLDPLLLTGWVHHGSDLCHVWAKAHPDIRTEGTIVLSACMLAGHWVPVVLTPQDSTLQFVTWDSSDAVHDQLNAVIEVIGRTLGFERVIPLRHQRLFFSSDKCGALAIAFLHHAVFNSMLPTSQEEAEIVHARLRDVYRLAVSHCQLAHRPWIWGAGDDDDDAFSNDPGQSSNAENVLPQEVSTLALSQGGIAG